MKNLRKKAEGFTIIEVMIVLVIAAIILLIVFLAIPALQRNSRNTQRRNDVANLLAAVNEYSTNNNGKLPPAIGDFKANANPGFYSIDTEVKYVKSPTNLEKIAEEDVNVYIYGAAKCDGNVPAAATSRQMAASYNVEVAGGLKQAQCQEG